MKGQYLAVETVTTFGMGLIVALGAVTAFATYQDDILSTAGDRQADVVQNRILEAVYTLENVDHGEKSVELPNELGSESYTVVLDEELKIESSSIEKKRDLDQLSDYEFRGTSQGGPVKIFKRGNQYRLEGS